MSPVESVAVMSTLESTVAPIEEAIVYKKFGEMELPEEEEEDGDYCPSSADSDDSLEWASETERTMAEDALAEGTVGLDFYGAAVSVATEYVSSYKPVQMGLGMATILLNKVYAPWLDPGMTVFDCLTFSCIICAVGK